MKRVLFCLVVGLALVAFQAGAAGAQTIYHMWIQGFMVYSANAHLDVFDGTETHHVHCGVGSLLGTLDGNLLNHPLYCLDIFHSFHFGEHWDVTRELIPPDPLTPPPYNTAEAAWIYQQHGRVETEAHKVGGIQLALWEISHDANWRTNWGSGNWWATGDLKYTDGATSMRDYATVLLADLRVRDPNNLDAQAYYYEPWPRSGNDYYGQGQVGDVPEPGVLMLLGTGLVGIAAVSWRNRRKKSA